MGGLGALYQSTCCGSRAWLLGRVHLPPGSPQLLWCLSSQRPEEEAGPTDPEDHQCHSGLRFHEPAACGLRGDLPHSQSAAPGGRQGSKRPAGEWGNRKCVVFHGCHQQSQCVHLFLTSQPLLFSSGLVAARCAQSRMSCEE